MKRLWFFAILSASLVYSCMGVEDKDGNVPEVRYFYINNSSHGVQISAVSSSISASVLDSAIAVGDTAQYWNYVFGNVVTGPFGSPEESAIVKIEFQGSEERCLVFSGPLLGSNDIRAAGSYSESDWHDNIVERYYLITDEHFSAGVPCQ